MSGAPNRLDRRGLVWGVVGVAVVVALTFIGSDRLVWFDAALVGYLFGVIFAVFGVAYRYAVWLRRPPTAMLEPSGLGRVPATQGPQRRRAAIARRDPPVDARVHPSAVPGTVARPPTRVLGVHPRRAGDHPAHPRCAALRERRPAGRPLPGLRVARRHAAVRRREHRRLAHLPRPRHRGRAGARAACSSSCAAGCATRARWRWSAPATSSPSPGCSPCRSPVCS